MSLRTPLARARGLGSAKGGTDHFWAMRVSSMASLLLMFFFFYAVFKLIGADYAGVKAFFASPIHATLSALFVAVNAHHMMIGMQVIIEDYIHKDPSRQLLLMSNQFFSILVGAVGVLAIIKLSLGA
ncbi:MAG: succinate dehydrogenase, hydrophobic membrane anchor protein [Hyphomicrobiales bacterium]|nr:succinate dehydrogenase, hydrophobic membrane anchor protein [Hyphomicrobiales bacterium]